MKQPDWFGKAGISIWFLWYDEEKNNFKQYLANQVCFDGKEDNALVLQLLATIGVRNLSDTEEKEEFQYYCRQ